MMIRFVILLFALLPGLVFAQSAVDVTGVTSALADAGTAIGTIGGAMLVAAGAGIAVKWVLGFLFK